MNQRMGAGAGGIRYICVLKNGNKLNQQKNQFDDFASFVHILSITTRRRSCENPGRPVL